MAYNYTNWSAINNMGDFLGVANANTGGWFWTAMNLMVWFVLMITMAGGFGFEAGLFTASFICLLVGILLSYMGLASTLWAVGPYLAVIIIEMAIVIWKNKYD